MYKKLLRQTIVSLTQTYDVLAIFCWGTLCLIQKATIHSFTHSFNCSLLSASSIFTYHGLATLAQVFNSCFDPILFYCQLFLPVSQSFLDISTHLPVIYNDFYSFTSCFYWFTSRFHLFTSCLPFISSLFYLFTSWFTF